MRLVQNKQNAIKFFSVSYNGKPRKAVQLFVGDQYIQLNPLMRDGKIVEHWDSMQQIPPTSQHVNTMY